MSADTRTRRPPRPAEPALSTRTAPRSLVSLLARATRIIDVLPHLHQHAVDSTHGICSLLLEHNPRTGALQATSGFGLDTLSSDPVIAGPDERALVGAVFDRGAPVLVADADRQVPELATRLGARAALLIPLVHADERVGLLVIGFEEPPTGGALDGGAAEAGDAFLAALEVFRLRESEELLRDLRELLNEFAQSLAATLNLSAGLDIFCHGANRLFGADRTSVWIHDRRARSLVLRGSTEPLQGSSEVQIPADDPLSPAAVAMRRGRAEILPGASGPGGEAQATVTV